VLQLWGTFGMSSSNSGPSVSTGITVNLLELVDDFPNYEVGISKRRNVVVRGEGVEEMCTQQ